jgi:hypothetical protein
MHQKDGEPVAVIPWASLCQQRMAHPIINLNQIPISQREAHGLVPPVGRGKTDAKERYASASTGCLFHLLCSLWPASPRPARRFLRLLVAAARRVEHLVSLKNQKRRMSKRALDPALSKRPIPAILAHAEDDVDDCLVLRASIWYGFDDGLGRYLLILDGFCEKGYAKPDDWYAIIVG